MPVSHKTECPNCGYYNRPRAVQCSLCRAILAPVDRASTAAPVAEFRPAAGNESGQPPPIPDTAPRIRSSFYAEKDRNIRNSNIMIMSLAGLLTALGASIGAAYGDPFVGAGVAFAIALGMTGFAWSSGASLIMSMSGAKKVSHDDYPQLYNIVEEMKIASGLPMPEVYVIKTDAPNAFATGRDPTRSAVAVTTGLLEKLDRDELQGVIAHEMGHIRNYDIRYAMLAGVLVGAVVLISDAFLRGRFRSGGRNQAMLILAIVLAIIAPISAYVLQMSISRRREFLADASAVEFTRNPDGLASALLKISADPAPLSSANRATQHLYIVNPLKKFSMKSGALFSTHPPTEARIRALRNMGAGV